MKPSENKPEQQISQMRFTTDPKTDSRILSNCLTELQKHKTTTLARRAVIAKRWIPKFAAAVLIFALCLFMIRDRAQLKPQQANVMIASVNDSPAGLMSIISLNMALRRGDDLEALEAQLDKAERQTRPSSRERITIEQLMCELEDCEEFPERETL